jgi:hypothetical protein
MNWLWIILVVAAIAGIIAYIGEKDKNEKGQAALGGAIAGGMGCGYLIMQVLIGLAAIWLLFKIGGWLFG